LVVASHTPLAAVLSDLSSRIITILFLHRLQRQPNIGRVCGDNGESAFRTNARGMLPRLRGQANVQCLPRDALFPSHHCDSVNGDSVSAKIFWPFILKCASTKCGDTVDRNHCICLNRKRWALNSAVECHLHTVEVIGSNPIAPTILFKKSVNVIF
jgi:hypothetical protein